MVWYNAAHGTNAKLYTISVTANILTIVMTATTAAEVV